MEVNNEKTEFIIDLFGELLGKLQELDPTQPWVCIGRPLTLIHPDGTEEDFSYTKGAAIKYNLNYGNLSHRGHSKGYKIK